MSGEYLSGKMAERFINHYGDLLNSMPISRGTTSEGTAIEDGDGSAKRMTVGRNNGIDDALTNTIESELVDLVLDTNIFIQRACQNKIKVYKGTLEGASAGQQWQVPQRAEYGERRLVIDDSKSQAVSLVGKAITVISNLFENSHQGGRVFVEKIDGKPVNNNGQVEEVIMAGQGCRFSILDVLRKEKSGMNSELVIITDGILPLSDSEEEIRLEIKRYQSKVGTCKILVVTDGVEEDLQAGFYKLNTEGEGIFKIDLRKLVDVDDELILEALVNMDDILTKPDGFSQYIKENVIDKKWKNGIGGFPLTSLALFLVGVRLLKSYSIPNRTSTWIPTDGPCNVSILWNTVQWPSDTCAWRDMSTAIYQEKPTLIHNSDEFLRYGTDVRDSGYVAMGGALALIWLGIWLRKHENEVKKLINQTVDKLSSRERRIRIGGIRLKRPEED